MREPPDYTDPLTAAGARARDRDPETAAVAALAAAVFRQAVEDLAEGRGAERRTAALFLDPSRPHDVRDLMAAALDVDGDLFAALCRERALSGDWPRIKRRFQMGGRHADGARRLPA